MGVPRVSIVICVKNEEIRIEDCLISVLTNNPDEVIVVDGNSSDSTVKIARKYNVDIVITKDSNLTKDRQIGIDKAKNDYVFLVDADHRLSKDDVENMFLDLYNYKFDAVQSQLIPYECTNWLIRGEKEMWEINHNIPGHRSMIGVAPTLYAKKIFTKIQFDDTITKTIDDTDFIYRLSQIPNIKYGIGTTQIKQLHDDSLKSYIKKFKWYGTGDGEFCIKHRNRLFSMLFHLSVRYTIIYSIKAILKLKFYAAIYCILQGNIRLFFCLKVLLTKLYK